MIWKKDSSLSVGFFLAFRDIRRGNPWTTVLITLVISLTFFNMLFIGGLFGGLVGTVIKSYEQFYSGDVLIIPSTDKSTIQQTSDVMSIVQSLPSLEVVSKRYVAQGTLEHNYKAKIRSTDISEIVRAEMVGIDPSIESRLGDVSKFVVAGSYLQRTDSDQIIVGSNLMDKYITERASADTEGGNIFKTADIGSRVRLTVNGIQKEFTIKGVITTNDLSVDSRVYLQDLALTKLQGNTGLEASEIAITLTKNASRTQAKEYLQSNLKNHQNIIIETADESLPSGITTLVKTMYSLGDVVGGIALIVSAITIFIVIFINAITRRKFIGILKGIGISARAIQISYMFQALFYAVCGVVLSTFLIFQFIVPFFELHPINLAGLDASLVIRMSDIIPRAIGLVITALVSGFIPAWLVTRQNTLNAILGR